MASPMVPVFCTPGLKIPSRTDSTVLSKSQEINKLLLPNHAGTPPLPDFETRWLKVEAMVVNSNYILRYAFTINCFSNVNLGFFSYATFLYVIVDLSNGSFVRTFINTPPKINKLTEGI